MAQKPDGKAIRTERVTFTRPAAERIAKTVRTVEAGSRAGAPLVFGGRPQGTPLSLSVATFTGSWQKGAWKTVTLHGSTATASVYNWCNSSDGSTSDTASSQFVVFGRANGTNSVLEISVLNTSQTCRMSIAGVDLTALPGYSAGTIQLLGHAAASTSGTACATLTWYSITTCSTAA